MVEECIFDLLETAVEYGHKRGNVFIEARYDNLTLMTMQLVNEIVREASKKSRIGVGIMAYIDGNQGYSFTPDLTKEAVINATERAIKIAKATASLNKVKVEFAEREAIKAVEEKKVKKHPKDVEFEEKLDLLKRGLESLKDTFAPQSTQAQFGELWGEKYFVNSEGSRIYWNPIIIDLRFTAIAMTESTQAVGFDGMGVSEGMEFYDLEPYTPEIFGSNAAKYCKEQTQAVKAPPGKSKALIGPRLAGVLAHESFGHLSESDFVINGMSPLADKIGEKLGSEHATIIDEGVIPRGYWLPFDDQGTPTKKTVIMDKGVLVSYLHNRDSAKKMNAEPTGNARAITYIYHPIPRMKNTYFVPGDLTIEEATELIGDGVYCIDTSGGQANLDGTFLFKSARGYLVEKGEITKPIKDVALSGQILDFIKHIIGATKDFEIFTSYFGGCGKAGQYPLPVGLGGPTLVVDEVLLGGEK